MPVNINKAIIAGTLTRDPEMGYTQKGMAVTKFSLAVNRTWKTEAGEKREDVSFFNATAFGRTGEVINEYFKKGGNIMIEARLKQDTWEDKATGAKRSAVNLIVESFSFLGKNASEPREDGEARPAKQARYEHDAPPVKGRSAPVLPAEEPQDGPPIDDDVPF